MVLTVCIYKLPLKDFFDIIAGGDQTTFDQVFQNFTIAVSSGIKTTQHEYDADALDTLAEQSDPQVTKVIADMETVDQTLQFFAAVSNLLFCSRVFTRKFRKLPEV